MSPAELRQAGIALYGQKGWQPKLAAALSVDGSTVRRWVSGAVSIPGPVVVSIRYFLSAHEAIHRPSSAILPPPRPGEPTAQEPKP